MTDYFVDNSKKMIQRVTGADVPTCPWKGFWECSEYIELSKWWETGQVALKVGNDPPYILIQGLEAYQAGVNAGRSDAVDRREEKLGKSRAKK